MEKKLVKSYDLDRITTRMKKDFGTIPKGHEEEYTFILSAMEGNLLKLHRQALTAIKMALLTINGYIRQVENDFSSHVTPENQALLHGLLMSFDPFTNEEVHEVVMGEDSSFDAKKYFAVPIKCLLRIEKSIEFWTKESGPNGYFNFIEHNMGKLVGQDDKMNFTILDDDSQI